MPAPIEAEVAIPEIPAPHGISVMALNTVFRIRLPADLEKAIRIAKANVADETIAVLESETGQWSVPFSQLATSDGWDDLVLYVFACRACGQRFKLSAETYHGSGGAWQPIE